MGAIRRITEDHKTQSINSAVCFTQVADAEAAEIFLLKKMSDLKKMVLREQRSYAIKPKESKANFPWVHPNSWLHTTAEYHAQEAHIA